MKALLSTAAAIAVTFSSWCQPGKQYTSEDYARAEQTLYYKTAALIDRMDVDPQWLPGDRFWYRTLTPQGSEFVLVDPSKKTRKPAFDQEKLAHALSSVTGKTYTAAMLPFTTFTYSKDGNSISFMVGDKGFRCDLSKYSCLPDPTAKAEPESDPDEVLSPDGKLAAYIQNYNLWVRDTQSGKRTQLTTDGVKDFGYATDNAGWRHSDKPVLRWSPDSKKIATFQQDQRGDGEMYLVSTKVGHPELEAWKYPLPGDSIITTIQRVIIDVASAKVVRFQMAPDPHRGTLSDDIRSSGTFDDVDWNPDDSELAFVSTSRDHKDEKFRIANANTGAIRDVFEEKVATQYESGQGTINWRYLPATHEIIWYSERDNWGHLYLYDAATGKLKNQITRGDWVVTELLRVDQDKRLLYFLVDGQEAENPYYTQLYKIGFDGKGLTCLTPEAGNHDITFSPDGKFFIDSYSKPDVPPVTVLRDLDGKVIVPLEKTDISRLTATGWHAPAVIKMKAHDGTTDIYGLLFTPPNLDASKKYPVIDYIYPGPQGGSVGSWGFEAARHDDQALAELGFIVVEIEGTANPLRSKSYHDMSYGNMAINTLPDQVTGIRQLAQRYSYMDTTRIGIWGHSGGGFATCDAMFSYPDFFKVGISESGNHDNRNYEDDWGERYDGLVQNADYAAQANENYAKNLKGKLLLAHGLMDDNVPPTNTMLVIDALEKANKDFDLVVFPNSHHGYGAFTWYMMRRRWDYFIENLMGAMPPHEYQFHPALDPRDAVGQ